MRASSGELLPFRLLDNVVEKVGHQGERGRARGQVAH